jgi:hypothetical protein
MLREEVFFISLWSGKTDLDGLIWSLRIYDHGLVRLHIYALLPDLFYGVQGKFLNFFKVERVVLNALEG